MTDSIVNKFQNFRNDLYNAFHYRSDAIMDLVDATAGNINGNSIVQLSLSSLFRREYSSITDAIHNLFCKKSDQVPSEEDLRDEQKKVTELLSEYCPKSAQRPFALFAVDCSANPRIYAETIEERGFVHTPNHIPGQKPVTVGHQYSTVTFLPEDQEDRNQHWIVPLSVRRVCLSEKGHEVGMEQVKEIISGPAFRDQLCVSVADSAYKSPVCTQLIENTDNWVHVVRLASNRTLFNLPAPPPEKRKRGRPRSYGEPFRLNWTLSISRPPKLALVSVRL